MKDIGREEIQYARESLKINRYSEQVIEYFNEVINIIESGYYARCKLFPSEFLSQIIDIQAIAHTHKYASFFDMLNSNELINYNFKPEKVNGLLFPCIKDIAQLKNY